MNDKCPLCGISVNEDQRETGELLLSANDSGGALEGLLNLVHVHCVRAMIDAARDGDPRRDSGLACTESQCGGPVLGTTFGTLCTVHSRSRKNRP